MHTKAQYIISHLLNTWLWRKFKRLKNQSAFLAITILQIITYTAFM